MYLVTVSKSRGNYNWCSNEVEICYKFSGIPKDVSYHSIVVADTYDLDLELPGGDYSPLMFAEDLLKATESHYFIFGMEENLKKIIKYLSDNEEEQSKLMFEDKYNTLIRKEKELSDNLEKIREIIKRYDNEKLLTKNKECGNI